MSNLILTPSQSVAISRAGAPIHVRKTAPRGSGSRHTTHAQAAAVARAGLDVRRTQCCRPEKQAGSAVALARSRHPVSRRPAPFVARVMALSLEQIDRVIHLPKSAMIDLRRFQTAWLGCDPPANRQRYRTRLPMPFASCTRPPPPSTNRSASANCFICGESLP